MSRILNKICDVIGVPAAQGLLHIVNNFRLLKLIIGDFIAQTLIKRNRFWESSYHLKHFILSRCCKTIFRGNFLVGEKISEYPQANNNIFKCHARVTQEQKNGQVVDTFTLQICGSIHAASNADSTSLHVLITDVTEGIYKSKPVHSRLEQWRKNGCPVFCYTCDLGKVPKEVTTLSAWATVGQIDTEWLIFPRKGKRNLRFSVSILSRQRGEAIASASFNLEYENRALGYVDIEDNTQRVKTLAVALAFAVSAADNKLFNCEIEIIKDWTRRNMDFSHASHKARNKLEKAFNKTVKFFQDGKKLNICKICQDIVEISSPAERYDFLELCLHVARAKGFATTAELHLVNQLAELLEVDMDKFRTMMQKLLPVGTHQAEDVEIVLGVTPDMSKDETRLRLNNEYRKWNARVTNFDAAIQAQADRMLKLIAQARSQCAK